MGAPFGLPELLALVMLAALVAYALMGGADFGGGLWDLLAFGPRAADQRRLIEQALAPVWEANHVWLIFVIVILFSAFPPAFAVLATALHVPLTLMLVGIVLRGSAFVFRQYGAGSVPQVRLWGRVFAIASVVAPFFLGTVLAAITEGVPVLPHFGRAAEGAQLLVAGVSWQWTSPFALVVGGFTLALFGYLAAVYLTLEAPDPHLAEAFRWRALIAGVVVGEFAFTSLFMARSQAPLFYARLLRSWWSWPLQITTGALAIGALYLLWRRRYRLARVLAVGAGGADRDRLGAGPAPLPDRPRSHHPQRGRPTGGAAGAGARAGRGRRDSAAIALLPDAHLQEHRPSPEAHPAHLGMGERLPGDEVVGSAGPHLGLDERPGVRQVHLQASGEVVEGDLPERQRRQAHPAPAQPGRHGRPVDESSMELEPGPQAATLGGVQVDALLERGLGGVDGGGDAPAGVPEVAAGLLRLSVGLEGGSSPEARQALGRRPVTDRRRHGRRPVGGQVDVRGHALAPHGHGAVEQRPVLGEHRHPDGWHRS